MKTKNKLFAVLALILMFTMLISAIGLEVFADDTPGSNENQEQTENKTEDKKEEKEKTAFEKWWDAYNQIIGICVAVILGIGIVVVIYLWIPKDSKKKGKKVKQNR